MRIRVVNVLLFTIFFNGFLFAGDSPFLRTPSLNSDGSKLAFSYQGDIWVVPSVGGKAERLTIHEAYDGKPFWSHDGSKIAFQSNRFGNYDIFSIPSEGGTPERHTYHSSDDYINDFTADGEIIFTTARNFRQVEWSYEIYTTGKEATPVRLLNATGNMPSVSPEGKYIAFTRGYRETRYEYRGSANYDIWLFNTESGKFTRLTTFDGHDIYPRWGGPNTLFYINSSSGKYNVYKLTIGANGEAEGEPEKLTNFTQDGVRYITVSADGNTIAMEYQTDIYTMKADGSSLAKVDIDIAADYRFDPQVRKTYSDKLIEYAVSPNGKYSALVIRGEIFITENDKEKSRTINLTNNPYRDQQVDWLNDSTIIFVSDREGQNDLYIIKSADPSETNLFESFKHEVKRITTRVEADTWPVVSPDGKKVAYEIGRGKLAVADISPEGELSNEITLLDGWDDPGNVRWSPDSKWLSYSLEDLYFNEEIYIHKADNSIEPVNVSMHPRYDIDARWSHDGKKLLFVSQRENNNYDIWFAWLNKKDWEKTKEDWKESDDDSKKKDKKSDSSSVPDLVIDLKDIHERLVQVTSMPGDEFSPEITKDGETIFFTALNPKKKKRDLFKIKWNGEDLEEVTSDGSNPSSVNFSPDYKFIYYEKNGKLTRVDSKGKTIENIPFEAKMTINYNGELVQKFDEAWRALNQGFYDPDFHGHDWNALRDKYRPWCLKASTNEDFQYIFNVLLGEVNASHMGMRGVSGREDTQKDKSGLLGIEIRPVGEGVEVERIIPDSPADKEESRLYAGDVITMVNQASISGVNFYSLLTNTVDEKILLTVEGKDGLRDVVIRPTSSLRNELYNEWVDERAELVDKYSDGRLGYLHIRAMGWNSFERFEREMTARGHGKEGIVIDVRFNGGGWTTDYLMTVLNYKQHAYTIPRGAAENLEKDHTKFRSYYPIGERLPYAAWTKPSIAICNQNSYSNAEIFSHAYQNLGIGTLVGTPTFGAVISTGARTLIDGSYVRMPFRGWYVKATDENMDFVPAVPDIIVDSQPDEKVNNTDTQLKKAVDELLRQIDGN